MAGKKYKTTLKFEVVVDPKNYSATQKELEDFFKVQAEFLKSTAPKGADFSYEVKSEEVPDLN